MIENWTDRGLKCLVPAAAEFRKYQTGIAAITDISIKAGDESLATIVDRRMEEMVLAELAIEMPEIAVFGEEGGENAGSGEYYMYFDPVDGTREMTTETSLSVMILALMKRTAAGQVSPDDRLVGTIICESSTGRFWAAEEGLGCWKFADDGHINLYEFGQCYVWEGPISRQSTVFFDSSQGGINTRNADHYQLLTDAQNADLYSLLNPNTHVRVLGPNGQIEALVANGARGVAGSMSLHLGWPWDACGVLLVIEAGGAAIASKIVGDSLVGVDPLAPNSYDFLVCANNVSNAGWLAEQLSVAYDHGG